VENINAAPPWSITQGHPHAIRMTREDAISRQIRLHVKQNSSTKPAGTEKLAK
jgi:hypothetical protein